jgi:hypothetical protein
MISLSRLKYRSVALLTLWGSAVAAGFLYLEAYAARPGEPTSPPVAWPQGSSIDRCDHRPTLVIFLHPHCPCSRASLAELAYVLSRCGGHVSTRAVLLHTPRLERWSRSEIEEDLAGLPEVNTVRDAGGVEAGRFRVATSGHVLLYDARGRLKFSGGITAARGHRGDNFGRAAVLGWILGEEGDRAGSPVFGCPLAAPRSTVR